MEGRLAAFACEEKQTSPEDIVYMFTILPNIHHENKHACI